MMAVQVKPAERNGQSSTTAVLANGRVERAERFPVELLIASLSTEADRPVGRVEGVASALTGRPLRYFIPDSLPELLTRYGVPDRSRYINHDPYVAFVLARSASRRGIGGKVDIAQALRFCDIVAGRKTYETLPQLMELGRQISPGNTGLRQEIIFAGATVASEAEHIFAPYPMLPQLMDSLVQENERKWEIDAAALMALVGFYCVHMHPFLDGNGRWSRMVASSIATSVGQPITAMFGAVFLNACKAELAYQIWPSVRAYGARRYLLLALSFDEEIELVLHKQGVFDTAAALNAELRKASNNLRDFQTSAASIYTSGSLPLERLKAMLGMSNRTFTGMLEKISFIGGGSIDLSRGCMDVTGLLAQVDCAVAIVKESSLSKEIDK